jgi:RNA polymerase sigma factor (sigma-70 family)
MRVVTRTSGAPQTDPTAAGWTELAAGRWQAAQTLFEASLAEAETPEALEGSSWAAWWLDDAAAVFATREAAYRLYRARGDAASAARMATWLAIDNVDFHGATSVAAGWVRRAHRLLEPLAPGPEHGWLAFLDGYLAHAAGESRRATEHAVAAAAIGRRFGSPDLEMLGLALEGAALVGSGEVEAGMRCLDEATATALEGEAAIPISGAWACCFLVTACTATLDYDRAAEWCARIGEFAERYGSRYMLAFCRSEYGEVYVWQGRWADAEQLLALAHEDYVRSRPAWSAAPLVALAELRRRQGRHAEAEQLLDRVSASTAATTCRAALALDAGDARRAVELLERLQRQLPAERRLARVPALLLLVRARLAGAEVREARPLVSELVEIADLAGTGPMRGFADLAQGLLAAAQGEHERARPFLEDAVDRLERSRAPFETARARIELAASLAQLGRDDVARQEAASALDTLLELGADAEARRARSVIARIDGLAKDALADLTPREREVIGLLAHGLTNRQIAERLVVSEHTVHRHVTNILRKLDLPSRSAAAAEAARAGLLDGAYP